MNVPDTQKEYGFQVGKQPNITLPNMNGAPYCINAVLATLD